MSRTVLHTIGRTSITITRSTILVIVAACLLSFPLPKTASADTAPTAGTPATVSADSLPTVQIDGVVWDQVTVGNKVYATGKFSTARPAGVELGGAGTVTRAGLLAYDLTTGILDPTFVHSLGGTSTTPCVGATATGAQGCSITASPDGTMLYVGGTFSTVDGQPHANIAAFNLATNTLVSGFQGVNNKVKAVAATNSGVYIGGPFSSVSGTPRGHLAYFSKIGTLSSTWNATVTGDVNGMVVASNKLIFGGSFTMVNGQKFWSNAAVSLSTGASITPWASQSDNFPIHAVDPSGQSNTALTSVSTDGTQVYFTSFTFGSFRTNTFEGRIAIQASNGALVWMNDCVGDSYDSFPIGQVLYSVGHMHGCAPTGFHQNYWEGPQDYTRAAAELTYRKGVNTTANVWNGPTTMIYPKYYGQPSSEVLDWYPSVAAGAATGMEQGAWSVTGNATYVALGGEFPRINGVDQQGLARFAIHSVAPNDSGPLAYQGAATASTAADTSGVSIVSVQTTYDRDNASLTYKLYRQGTTLPIATKVMKSRLQEIPVWTFNDGGRTPGSNAAYRVEVTDTDNNTITSSFVVNTQSPIDLRNANDKQFRQTLGAPTAAEVIVSPTVRYRDFVNGRAYWGISSGGVYYVIGTVQSEYIRLGAHTKYGVPKTDPVYDRAYAHGMYNDFLNGTFYANTNSTGAFYIGGPLRDGWRTLGGAAGPCRYPSANTTSVSGGTYNIMAMGACRFYYSAATGVHYTNNAIGTKYYSLGASNSTLGFPTSDPYTTGTGLRSNFQSGYITWTSATGVVTVVNN